MKKTEDKLAPLTANPIKSITSQDKATNSDELIYAFRVVPLNLGGCAQGFRIRPPEMQATDIVVINAH